MVNQDTDIVALMDIATLVHDTEYKTKQSFGESDPQRLITKKNYFLLKKNLMLPRQGLTLKFLILRL
jgi:hypothetical protein